MTSRGTKALLAAILGASFLSPSAALADARDDARRFFRRGMELIAQGQHMEGAQSLERANELMPHPSVLYNIGLAYADAGAYDKAIDAFQRYLDTDPEDGAAVQRLMRLLDQQRTATAGASAPSGEGEGGAQPATTAGGGATAAGEGTATVAATPELMALLKRLEGLADKMERPTEAAEEDLSDLSTEELRQRKEGDFYARTLVSASRTSSSPVDAPAATTVITAEQIRLSGATNIPDLLRQVPGLHVMTMTAGNANVAIRGFNQRIANKTLVLVDGRSVYLDFLGATLFRMLSISLEDIERIEVIRGPSATLYGANAFGGIINIITKQYDRDGGQLNVTAGNGETLMGGVRFGGRKGIFGYQGSVGYEQTDQFEMQYGERSDFEFTGDDPTLAVRALRANGALTLVPEEDKLVRLSGGLNYGYDSFFGLGLFREFWLRGVSSNVRADVQLGGLKVRAFWNHFNVNAPSAWQPVGGLVLAGSPTSNTIDVEGTYTGSLDLGPVNMAVSAGGGYRVKTIDWEFLDGPHVEQHLSGFIEDRVTFIPQLQTVLGFRFDQHPLLGFTPSPRAVLMIKPTERQSIRASIGTAFRTPTFTESYLQVDVPGPVTGAVVTSLGNTELEPEQNITVEVGWVAETDYVEWELAGWYQRVNNFISLSSLHTPEVSTGLQGDAFQLGTSQWLNRQEPIDGFGGEVGVHAYPVVGLDVRANYAYSYFIDVAKRDAGEEDFRDKRHPQHLFNLGVSYKTPIGLDINYDLHVVSATDNPERSFDSAGSVVVNSCTSDAYPMMSARLGYRLPGDKLEVGVTATNFTAWGKDGGHREHCLAQNVGPRVMGSVSYRF